MTLLAKKKMEQKKKESQEQALHKLAKVAETKEIAHL
jgi:hypothetical protein